MAPTDEVMPKDTAEISNITLILGAAVIGSLLLGGLHVIAPIAAVSFAGAGLLGLASTAGLMKQEKILASGLLIGLLGLGTGSFIGVGIGGLVMFGRFQYKDIFEQVEKTISKYLDDFKNIAPFVSSAAESFGLTREAVNTALVVFKDPQKAIQSAATDLRLAIKEQPLTVAKKTTAISIGVTASVLVAPVVDAVANAAGTVASYVPVVGLIVGPVANITVQALGHYAVFMASNQFATRAMDRMYDSMSSWYKSAMSTLKGEEKADLKKKAPVLRLTQENTPEIALETTSEPAKEKVVQEKTNVDIAQKAPGFIPGFAAQLAEQACHGTNWNMMSAFATLLNPLSMRRNRH